MYHLHCQSIYIDTLYIVLYNKKIIGELDVVQFPALFGGINIEIQISFNTCLLYTSTIITAIVSPIARPSPRTTADITPDLPPTRTALKIERSFVAPRASEPSTSVSYTHLDVYKRQIL